MMTDMLPGFIIALPFLAAAIIRLPFLSHRRGIVDGISVITAAGTSALAIWACLLAADTPLIQWVGGWEPQEDMAVGIALVADGFSAGFIALTASLVTAALLFMVKRYKTVGSFLHMFTLLFLGAFSGFVLVEDLLTMFVFLELMGISCYIMTAFKVQDEAPAQAGINIGVVGTIGTFIFLMGVAIIYKISGTPNIAESARLLSDIAISPAIILAFSLLLIGLAIKSGFIPFHFAHADSHAVSPAPQAGLFSAVLLPAALYGIAKLLHVLFTAPAASDNIYMGLLLSAGISTALIAATMSVVQNHLKRLLAFSSIAHLGIAAVGVSLLSSTGMAGAGLYVIGHGAVKMALFLTAGLMLHQFSDTIIQTGKKVVPVIVMLIVGGLLLAGLPPAGLYGGKVLISEAAKEANVEWVMYPIYLSAALTGGAIIRFVIRLFTPEIDRKRVTTLILEGSRETDKEGGIFLMTTVPVLLLLVGILLPLLSPVVEGIAKMAEHDFDHLRYIKVILSGEADPATHIFTHDLWKAEELLKGTISAVSAVFIGCVAAWYPDFGNYRKSSFKILRQLHSGHVGDYLVWLMLGFILTAGWMFVKISFL